MKRCDAFAVRNIAPLAHKDIVNNAISTLSLVFIKLECNRLANSAIVALMSVVIASIAPFHINYNLKYK